MYHTGYEWLGLFFVYSFIGWILETVFSALKLKRFVNRGLVNGPMCTIYGIGAVVITVFGWELSSFWLFLGSMIFATVLEWTAGHLIERLYQERWWDYSQMKWNLDGYISVPSSVIWGVLGVIMMKGTNPLFLFFFRLLPQRVYEGLVLVVFLVFAVDVAASLIVLAGRSRRMAQWQAVDSWLTGISSKLSRSIYHRVDERIKKAYPERMLLKKAESKPEIFAYGCSIDKFVWLLVIGSFLGDIVETIFCYIKAGVWMSRSSVVWGPFSLVWGIAIAMITVLFYRYRERSETFLFLLGTFLGGAYEYICSVFTEIVFGKVFWDYSSIPFNLGGRINLLYCFFWGIASVVWFKICLPKVEKWMEKIPVRAGKIITLVMVVFMSINIAVSSMALTRSTQRADGIPAEHSWQQVMDERFPDERMERIYPNAVNTN